MPAGKRLIDMMSNSKSENKKIPLEKDRAWCLYLKIAHVTIKYISCVKNFWWRHNPTILTCCRKEEVKNILDGNKENETNSRSEVVEISQRSVEHVITEPSVIDICLKWRKKTESVSEFNVNSNFKGHFEVAKAETAVISAMKLLSDIGSSVETIKCFGKL